MHRTTKATPQAMAHWVSATPRRGLCAAHLPLHGGDGRHAGGVEQGEGEEHEGGEGGVNMPPSAWGRVVRLEPVSTARVLTTASLAEKPG